MRIAVCLHLFYMDMLSEMAGYINRLEDHPIDLYITMPEENTHFEKSIKAAFPQARIIVTKNIGFDIYPFLCFLNSIDLDKYDLIVKLHTKKDIPIDCTLNGFDVNGSKWRDYLFTSVLGSKERINEIIQIFAAQEDVGMIGAQELLIQGDAVDQDIDMRKVERVMNDCGLKVVKKEFIAGSVFVVKASLFKPLKERNYRTEEFPPYFPRDWNGLPYCIERLFGCMVSAQGYRLVGIHTTGLPEKPLRINRKIGKVYLKIFIKKVLPPSVLKYLKKIRKK